MLSKYNSTNTKTNKKKLALTHHTLNLSCLHTHARRLSTSCDSLQRNAAPDSQGLEFLQREVGREDVKEADHLWK